nr:hypothetical protein 15 [Desulfobulbaceae bacterium]
MQPQKWSVSGLSVELGRDRRTIDRAIADAHIEPVDKQGKSKLYRMADVVEALYAKDRLDLSEERAALARAQRIKIERENQLAVERKMIPQEDVEAAFKQLSEVIKRYLLHHFHARKLPPLLAKETDIRKCSALLKEARDEMFADMRKTFEARLKGP